MKKKITTKPKKEDAFCKMADAIAEYIEALGGTAMVLGNPSVYREPGALKYNYIFQIRVTGKEPRPLASDKKSN